MSILVTGGSGFIGWHLVNLLRQQGRNVRCLVRRTSKVRDLEAMGVSFDYGDLQDEASLANATQGIDLVFHLAGLTKAVKPSMLLEMNGEGTRKLAAACRTSAVRCLVCASSLAAVGPSPGDGPLTESCNPNPVSAYGKSKLAGERALQSFAGDLEISVVRPPIVIGQRDPASLEMFRSIHRWRVHVLPGFTAHPFSIIHAEDLARLLLMVAEKGERLSPETSQTGQGIYFAECEDRPTYRQIGELIGRAIDRKALMLPIGPRILRMAGRGSDWATRITGRAQYFSGDKVREALAGPWICSAEKASAQLGFEVARTLDKRFQETGNWYLENGWL